MRHFEDASWSVIIQSCSLKHLCNRSCMEIEILLRRRGRRRWRAKRPQPQMVRCCGVQRGPTGGLEAFHRSLFPSVRNNMIFFRTGKINEMPLLARNKRGVIQQRSGVGLFCFTYLYIHEKYLFVSKDVSSMKSSSR